MEGNVFTAALERIEHVKSPNGEILTKPFLELCKMALPVLDNFGPAMAPVKSDINGNISRLETKYLSSPSEFDHLYKIIQLEVESKKAKSSSSCTIALLWLTRAMDFLSELFHNLSVHPDWSLSQVCTDSYDKSLKKWHNWLASSSFNVVLKLAPDRKKFMCVIGIKGDDDIFDIEKFCSKFSPLLKENHKFLARIGVDNMKA